MSQAVTTSPAAFDYSTLKPAVAEEARATATRIRNNEQTATQAVLDIGNDLIAIKAQLEHGQFIAWVEAECAVAARTVQNYMKAAQAFDGKHATVAHLAPTTVYALASAPAPARDTILERIEAGERPTETVIRNAIYDAKAAEKVARQEAKLTPAQKKNRQKAKEKAAAESQRRQEQWYRQAAERQEAAERAATIIRAALNGNVTELCQQLELSDDSPRLLLALAPPPRRQPQASLQSQNELPTS